jgi:hypothetical protein
MSAEQRLAAVTAVIDEKVTLGLPVGRRLVEADKASKRPDAQVNPDALLALMSEAEAARAALNGVEGMSAVDEVVARWALHRAGLHDVRGLRVCDHARVR